MKAMTPSAAYVLNRRIYKESSLLLDVFTYDYGRQSILAQGALKSKKGWSALLQVFQPLMMSWAGRGALKTLVSVEAPSAAITLLNERLYSAYYLNELILKLFSTSIESLSHQIPTDIEAHQKIFMAYAAALAALQLEENIELPLRRFEFCLLEELGVFPDFRHDINGVRIQADHYYQLICQQGFALSGSFNPSDILNRIEIHGSVLNLFEVGLNEIERLPMDQCRSSLQQLKKLMRTLIDEALEGKELKSRALFHRFQPNRSMS
jgi:DNA repair protein RecO (recombination protein O)